MPATGLGNLLGSSAASVVSTCLTATGGKSDTTGLPADPSALND